MASAADELVAIAEATRRIHHRLTTLCLNPFKEVTNIMAALDTLKALEPRLDAIAAAIGTDTATAVANAVAPLNAQIATLQSAATQTESDTQAEADTLTAKVAVIEPLVGITPPVTDTPAAS